MRRSGKKNNRKTLLTVLVLISVIGYLLPARITGKFISLVQVLIPLQDWTTRSMDAVVDATGRDNEAVVPRDQFNRLYRENQALRHQLASMANRYHELEQEHQTLTGIRHRGLGGGRLVPARVVAADALAWRETRLINVGTLSGVKPAAPVTSHYFTVYLDGPETIRNGLSVLSGETLVGFVDQAGTHSARVRLLTDRNTKMSVLIARSDAQKFYPLDAEFWLVGTGKPFLEIRDVDHRYIKSGAIKKGDVVLTNAYNTLLPASMTIGTITEVRIDPNNTLLYRLDVTPPLALNDVRKVFVVAPDAVEALEQ